MAIPLSDERLPVTWGIALKKPPQQFTASNLEEAVGRVALVGALLENQMLAGELARANEQIDRDARRVGELQRGVAPGISAADRRTGDRGELRAIGPRRRRPLRLLSS